MNKLFQSLLLLLLAFRAHGQYVGLANHTSGSVSFQTAEPFGLNWFGFFSTNKNLTVEAGKTNWLYQPQWPWASTPIINGGHMLYTNWGVLTANQYYSGTLDNGQPVVLKSSAQLDNYDGYCGSLYDYMLIDLGYVDTPPRNTNPPPPYVPVGGPPTCPISGMATYSFHPLSAGLIIKDTPLVYTPPVGPTVQFNLTYLQRGQPDNSLFANCGPSWNLSALSYIVDTPNSQTNSVLCFVQGGGAESYMVDANTGAFTLQPSSHTTLSRQSGSSYARFYPDGSRDVYVYPQASTNDQRNIFLTASIDPFGNSLQYNYETLADGAVRLMEVVDAVSRTNRLSYGLADDPLKITAITDPFGHATQFGYAMVNECIQLVSITDPVGIVSQFSYGPNNCVTALTTPYGTTTFATAEDTSIRMIEATDPLGQTEHLEYRVYAQLSGDTTTPSGILTSTDDYGVNDTYYWNKKAWAQYGSDVTKAEITHWASPGGQLQAFPLWTKKPLENRVWYNYPGQIDGKGTGITNYAPSVVARVLDDGTTQKSTQSFDTWGNVTNAIDAIGRKTIYIYADNGIDLLEVRQAVGSNTETIATLTYNQQHLPTVAVLAGITNAFGYTATGQLRSRTNGLGQVTSYNYDVNWYLTNVTGHLPSDVLNICYDTAGRIYSITDSQGYSVTNTYDALNRLIATLLPDGSSMASGYSALDATQVKGRDNRWTYHSYNANRQLTDVQDVAGRIFHYEWCGCGALDSITDPNGQMTFWMRDLQNRATQKIYADLAGDAIAYENTTSRVKQTTDAAGKNVNLAYNKDDTLQQVSYSGGSITPSVSFTYDTNYSRIAKMVDGIGTHSVSYVHTGQPGAGSVQSITGPLPNSTITFGYDPLGRPLSVQVGTATSAVQYDQLGRVWWSSNLLGVTTIQYVDVTGSPASINRPNGLTTTFGYTPISDGSRLQSMITTNGASQVVERYDYGYDNRDLILWQTNLIGGVTTVWNYSYDLAQQLTGANQWTNGVLAHRYAYTYDSAGNRLSEQIDTAASAEVPNALNQIASRSGGGQVRVSGYLNETGLVAIAGSPAQMLSPTNFAGMLSVAPGTNTFPVTALDASGNATTNWYNLTITANGLPTSFAYDAAGNLLMRSNSSQVLTFGWDGADRCTAITNGNLRTALSYDGLGRWARITEYSNSTTTADRRFVYNGLSLAEERDSTGTNVVKRFFQNGFWQQGTNYYYVTDHLGSVREVTLVNGTVVARFEYDPWGRRTQTFGTFWVDFGFAGLFEFPNGLKLAVWRMYDPSTGRWNSKDPIREKGGWNLYAYCEADPVHLKDPTGLATYIITFEPLDVSSSNPVKLIPHTAVLVVTGQMAKVYSFDPLGLHTFNSLQNFMQIRNPKQNVSLTKMDSAFNDGKIIEYYESVKKGKYLLDGEVCSSQALNALQYAGEYHNTKGIWPIRLRDDLEDQGLGKRVATGYEAVNTYKP